MSNQSVDSVFDALGEPVRRRILELLREGPTPVGRLAQRLPVGRPAVSKHLRVLSEVGLVRCRAEGRRRLYRLEPARLRPLQEWLAKYERAWHDRMDRMDDYLRELQRGERQ